MQPQPSKRRPNRPRVPRTCERCGAVFFEKPSRVENGKGRFCSRACLTEAHRGAGIRPWAHGHTGPKPTALADRFWAKVEKGDGCWLWTGAKRNGYGAVGEGGHDGPGVPAHRVSWGLHYGRIPPGWFVCHHCDTPACVRPDHLFIGPAAANNEDMRAKGRGSDPPRYTGSAHPRALLTDAQVLAIRSRYRFRRVTQQELANEYGVSLDTIKRIIHRRNWTHL